MNHFPKRIIDKPYKERVIKKPFNRVIKEIIETAEMKFLYI